MTATVKEILQKQRAYVASMMWSIREADEEYNNINRELIEAYKNEHGSAFLGRVNFYDAKRQEVVNKKRSVYTEYTGQLVYNFGYDFVVPNPDEELEELIRQWNSNSRSGLVEQIMNRINELGGINFVWY